MCALLSLCAKVHIKNSSEVWWNTLNPFMFPMSTSKSMEICVYGRDIRLDSIISNGPLSIAKASKDVCLSFSSHLGTAADVSGFSHLYHTRAPGIFKGTFCGPSAVKGCFTTQLVWSSLSRSLGSLFK